MRVTYRLRTIFLRTSFGLHTTRLEPGAHMLPSYLRHRSHMRNEVACNRGQGSLYRRHACEVDSSSTSQACRRYRPAMFLVAGGIMSSYVGEVSQAVPAAMSQVLRWHMRTRLYSETSLIRTLTGAIESVRIKRVEFRENEESVSSECP